MTQTLAQMAVEVLTTAEYWEVSDRGINFDYLPDEQREQLPVFFSWFQSLPSVD